MRGRAFFKTLFVISSGPGALSGATLATACCTCLKVILVTQWTLAGYGVWAMSFSLAGGGAGKNVSLSKEVFSSVVSALLSKVGMNVGI